MKQVVRYWSWIVFANVSLVVFVAALVWPASSWLAVRSVHFSNVLFGESPAMTLDRSIKVPFHATWSITIRKWEGAWFTYCTVNGEQGYRPDAKLPKDVDLKWWTRGQCHPLTPGRYEVSAFWNIETPAPLPDKQVQVVSNVFEVSE